MRKKIITFILLSIFFPASASELAPSEIEVLQQEFESLNKYKSPTSYKIPAKDPANSLERLKFNSKKVQFADLDEVFDEADYPLNTTLNSKNPKRKRQ